MDGHRAGLLLTVGVVLLAASGASCPRVVPPQGNLFSQAVLPPSPSLEQIIAAVNNNSQQIQTFSTNRATINGAGFPALRASVFFERPRRFRLRAETALTGPELDLGSNDELFWIWVRRNQPQALYYCRHDQYPTSQARQALGIDPDWLVEAVGITQFDPSLPHQGPFPRPNNRYEIRTIRETANGPTTKITIIDGSQALVLEQHLLDSQGQLAKRHYQRTSGRSAHAARPAADCRHPLAQIATEPPDRSRRGGNQPPAQLFARALAPAHLRRLAARGPLQSEFPIRSHRRAASGPSRAKGTAMVVRG